MKRILGYTGSFICYWSGHGVSLVMRKSKSYSFFYPVYHKAMTWSTQIEDWAGITYKWGVPE